MATQTPPTTKRNFRNLARRLELAGLGKDFVRAAILPEWWGREHEQNLNLLPEVEFSVARFLKTSVEAVRDPLQELAVPDVHAKLRKPRHLAEDQLSPSVFAAVSIAEAVVRNLRRKVDFRPLPEDPMVWREELLAGVKECVTLRTIVAGLWARGIPVVHIHRLPTKKFRGMVCCVEDRPVVLLAWNGNDSPRFLTDTAHEAGHIAQGHVKIGRPMLDEEEAVEDEPSMDGLFDEPDLAAARGDDEKAADGYGYRVLKGNAHFDPFKLMSNPPPGMPLGMVLAKRARAMGKELSTDAGLLVNQWAFKTGQYKLRKYALRVLDKQNGLRILREYMQYNIDFESASETDSALLRCVLPNEASHR